MFIMKGSEHVVLSCVVSVNFFLLFLKFSNNSVSCFIPLKTSVIFRFRYEDVKCGSLRADSVLLLQEA